MGTLYTSQFCCEPKTAEKKKYYLKRNYVSSQDEFIFQPEKKTTQNL